MPDESPVAAIFDRDEVRAFLRDQPAWWRHGLMGFGPTVPDHEAPLIWTFSAGAKQAFEAWQRAREQTT